MNSNHMLAVVLLLDATADAAHDMAAAEHERRHAAALAAEAERRRREEERRRRILRRTRGLAVQAVAAAFATSVFYAMAAAFGDDLAHTVWFMAANVRMVDFGDFGVLWLFVSVGLLAAVAALTFLAFTFPYPDNQEVVSTHATVTFWIGSALFFFIAINGAPAIAWWMPALFAVLGHLYYGKSLESKQGT